MKRLSRCRLVAASLLAPFGAYFVGVFDKIVFSDDFYTTPFYRNSDGLLNINNIIGYFEINTIDLFVTICIAGWVFGIPVVLMLYKTRMLSIKNVMLAGLSCAALTVLGLGLGLAILAGRPIGAELAGLGNILAFAMAGAFFSALVFCLVGGVGWTADGRAPPVAAST